MASDFFYYSFLNNMLIGSEDPNVCGNARDVAADLCNRYNIKHMITVSPEYSDFMLDGLKRYHVPIYDLPLKKDIEQLFGIIDSGLSRNEAVWVHCWRGIDRTGCVIGSYLVRKGNNSHEVINELLQKFKCRIKHPRLNELLKDNIEFIRQFAKIDTSGCHPGK